VFPQIEELDLSGTSIRVGGALSVAATFPALRALDVGDTYVGNAGALAIARSRCAASLRRLGLARTGIGQRGVADLLATRALDALEALDVGFNELGIEGVRALAAHPFDSMERLAVPTTTRGVPIAPCFEGGWVPVRGEREVYARRLAATGLAVPIAPSDNR
jgi:hypothetical protein